MRVNHGIKTSYHQIVIKTIVAKAKYKLDRN